MKTLSDIIAVLTTKVGYPEEIVDYHVRRIVKKLEYTPIIKETYSKSDAEAIEFISSKFFEERKRRERKMGPVTALMPKIEPASTAPQTKPMPVIKSRRWKFPAK